MARFGFIHGKLDIKLLILYLLSRVAAPIDFATLTDLCLCDEGVDYFLYAEAAAELLDSGHLVQEAGHYAITDKGRRVCADGESSLSPVIRQRCDQRLTPLNAALKRRAQVRAGVEPLPGGAFQVRLDLEDDQGSLLSLSLLASTQEDGEQIARRFTDHPDRIYNGILGVLLSDGPQKGGVS
ncbi:MAG TPA: DUF4364 family protein [Candidatus Enterenecus merdae]|nr:DUF4364 family protein [Candidatus Enterenecus merdae]